MAQGEVWELYCLEFQDDFSISYWLKTIDLDNGGCHFWFRKKKILISCSQSIATQIELMESCYSLKNYWSSIVHAFQWCGLHQLSWCFCHLRAFSINLLIKKAFYYILEYSQLTMLWEFQVDSKGTQTYTYMYPPSPKLPSHPGSHITLIRVPCARQ